MNTRNEVKITFGTPKYVIYGAETKCYMPFEVKLPPLMEQIATLLIDKKIIPALPKGVKAIATMQPGDEYDEKTGLKVAMAKAEIDAYTIVNNWLVDINDLLIYKIYDKVGDFVEKAEIVINHDVNFVRKF
jgi:hypothetical protein